MISSIIAILGWVLLLAAGQGGVPVRTCNHAHHTQEHSTLFANDPMHDYDVCYYGLHVQVDDMSTKIKGSNRVLALVAVDSIDIFEIEMNSVSLQIDSILFLNNKLAFSHDNNRVTTILPHCLYKGELVDLTFFYGGISSSGAGLFRGLSTRRVLDPNQSVTWTLSEPFQARDWFPCKQDLKDKIDSVDIRVTVPSGLMAGSNGILTHVDVDSIHDLKTYHWKSRYPIAYYLISIAVSDYMDYSFYAKVTGIQDSILVQNFIYNDSAYFIDNKDKIDITADMIELFSGLFGIYPFYREKYGHCTAPMGGGMEHQTMTTLSSFEFSLVAHELGHQWFGNHVTCGTWQDIWINEGFASYTEYIALQYLKSQESADNWMSQTHFMAKASKEGSIYVPHEEQNNASRIFDYFLSYKKGAAIIHMIRHEIDNDSVFFRVLREFQSTYSHSTATGEEFRQLLDSVSGMDFRVFFEQWYFGKGHPGIRLHWSQDGDTLVLSSELEGTSAATTFNQLSIEYKLIHALGEEVVRLKQTRSSEVFRVHIPQKVNKIVIDPDKKLLLDILEIIPISADNLNNAPFEVYPNPFRDYLQFRFRNDKEYRGIKLTDTSGSVIAQGGTSDIMYRMDLPGTAPGFYLVRVEEKKETHAAKVICTGSLK
jgi:aminopeptidase N